MSDEVAVKAAVPLWLRILQFPLVRLVLLGAVLYLLMGVSNGTVSGMLGTPWVAVLVSLVFAAIGLAIYYGFVRVVEQRPVTELGRQGMGRELGLGILVGAGLYTACVVILVVLGVYRVDGLNPVLFVLPGLAMAISSGVLEELIYRGTLFRIVEESLGSWISIVVSSLFFGLRHMTNPDATIAGALAITIEAGVLLAAAFMVTRRLWLPIGIHMAWNFTQAGIFSGVVSGAFNEPGLLKSRLEGSELLTGGAFGVEASLVAVLVCTAAGVAMLIIAVKRGHVVKPFWLRTS